MLGTISPACLGTASCPSRYQLHGYRHICTWKFRIAWIGYKFISENHIEVQYVKQIYSGPDVTLTKLKKWSWVFFIFLNVKVEAEKCWFFSSNWQISWFQVHNLVYHLLEDHVSCFHLIVEMQAHGCSFKMEQSITYEQQCRVMLFHFIYRWKQVRKMLLAWIKHHKTCTVIF
jgi:hypothetical protein